jgi:hypothetical protein
MKYFNFLKTKLIMWAVLFVSVVTLSNAQTAKIQLVHNAADPLLNIVDVYWNDMKLDNVSFRKASPLMTVNSGASILTICDSSSTDSGTMVLAKLNVSLATGSQNIAMLSGVLDNTQFLANPSGLSTKLNVYLQSDVNYSATAGNCFLNIAHGVTDAPAVDINVKIGSSVLKNAAYGAVSNSLLIPAKNVMLEIREHDSVAVLKTYYAPISFVEGRSGFIFASGFLNTTNNNNGAGFGLFGVDTAGLVASFGEGGMVQFVHNSPDAAVGNVDVYLNGQNSATLGFRNATKLMALPAGTATIEIKKAGTSQVLYTIPNFPVTKDNNSIAMIHGLLDTSFVKNVTSSIDTINKVATRVVINALTYDRNPDGKDRSFKVTTKDIQTSASLFGNNQIMLFQGITGLNAADVKGEGEALYIARGISYGEFGEYRYTKANASTKYLFTKANTSVSIGEFTYNFTGKDSLSGVLFTSGFSRVADTVYIKKSLNQTNDIDSLIYNTYNKFGSAGLALIVWPDGTVDTLKTEKKYVNSVKSIEGSLDVTVYPNPANDRLFVSFDNAKNESTSLQLFNLQGKEFAVDYNNADLRNGRAELNLQSLSKGMYFLSIQIGDKKGVQKLIVE